MIFINFYNIDIMVKTKLSENNDINNNSGNKIDSSLMDNRLSTNDLYKLSDLYFKQKNIIYSHLYNSFNKFLDEDVKNILKYGDNVFHEKLTVDKLIKYKFKYDDIAIKPPSFESEEEVMFPSDAITRSMTYSVKLVATVTQVQEIIDVSTNKKEEKIIGYPEKEVPIAVIPTMVRSKYCSLNLKKGKDKVECELDPGGYFIVNGSEKVVVSLERISENKPLTFSKKDSNTIIYTVQVNSKSHNPNGLTQILAIRMKKDNTMFLRVPIFNDISVFILFRALGIESDKEIIDLCVYDKNDTDMMNLIRLSLEDCVNERTKQKIITNDEAIDYLTTKLRILKKYTDTDKDIKYQQKKMHVQYLLSNSFLPHIEGDKIYKAYYLGYMINRLMNVVLGRVPVDDRDSFVNKRIDLPGDLICELFKQHYKKMLNECARVFRKRNIDDLKPFNIINQIKPNIIEQGLKTSLLTGAWSGKRKGVAQLLERKSYLNVISSIRRVNSPTVDASTNKLTSPRHIHPTQIGFICFVETPEGHKVGLTKTLSLIGNVTVSRPSQVYILKSLIKDEIKDLRDVPIDKIGDYCKVFVNGEWLGLSFEPNKIYKMLKKKKVYGDIEYTTSVVFDIEKNELKINCDGGRLFRPMLRVKKNKLVLSRENLNTISIEDTPSPTSITKWNEFLMKYPGVIEYIDMEEQPQIMLAMLPTDVDKMRDREINSIKEIKNMSEDNLKNIVNRYDDTTFVRYTHCEIDPSLLVGTVVSNTPYFNHNQGPRNMFQFSQAKQGIGLYISNWRHRLDLGYILYNAQKPLVNTRNMKYLNTDKLTYGENVIVAIQCYTGYNQEDSVLLNKSALDRGLFRLASLKKAIATIKKNQSTSQNDMFIKPDPLKVTGMGFGSYDKLNDEGHVPEETKIENNDIFIGVVTPIQPSGKSDKIYKDNSEVYKSYVPGIVDKVYSNIYNHEGYEMKKVRIRSERIPIIGDKFCSRHGQKGTVGLVIPQCDMPFNPDTGMSPDLIMNPNAIPSRMTLGQFIECVTGKIGAIKGCEVDGSPFQEINIKKIRKELKDLGFRDDGTEVFYSGMTGKQMNRTVFVGPTYYMRLKHMVMDKIHCLTMDHEVLTENGWKFFKDIKNNEKVATIIDGNLSYEKPKKLLYFPNYQGEMYHVKNQQIDLNVTSNHRMYVSTCKKRKQIWSDYELIEANKIYGKHTKYLKNAVNTQNDYQFILPEITDKNIIRENKKVNMDAWLTFFGIWMTSFCKDSKYIDTEQYCITINLYNERVQNVITESFKKLDYNYNVSKDKSKIYVYDRQLYNYLKNFSVDKQNKFLPEWVWKLSQEQSRKLIESMVLGDGSIFKRTNNDDNLCYYTSSVKLSNDFQRLCLHAGWSANISFIKGIKNDNDLWKLGIIKNKNSPSVNNEQNIQTENIYNTQCDVFCLEMPNETFYVRRNGKPVWTGNSRARGPKTLLTHQAPEGRSRDGGLRFGEMERDCIIAHGMSKFLKERMLETSDAYTTYVCDDCGLFAQRMKRPDNKPYPTNKDIYHCPACKNKTRISKVMIPYAFKLLIQELMSMNIASRLRIKKNRFNETG